MLIVIVKKTSLKIKKKLSKYLRAWREGGSILILKVNLILQSFVLDSYQTFITAWKNSKQFLSYKKSKKSMTSIGSLWEVATKDHFTKNLFFSSFFKQISSNIHRKSIIKLKKIKCWVFMNFENLNYKKKK